MLKDCVNLLVNAGYLMRTGFDQITFVHWKFALFWVIKTYNVLRLEKVSFFTFNLEKINKLLKFIGINKPRIREKKAD